MIKNGCVCAGELEDAAEEASAALTRSLVPLFDAFWQGRLIPGAQIESLPFIEVMFRSICLKDTCPCQMCHQTPGASLDVLPQACMPEQIDHA